MQTPSLRPSPRTPGPSRGRPAPALPVTVASVQPSLPLNLNLRFQLCSRLCLHLALGVLLAPLATGCRPSSPSAPGEAHASGPDSGVRAPDFPTNVIAYEVRGVLKEIRAGGTKALVAHEDIPGYMEAMTMLLDVRPTNSLAGIAPGDAIDFRMLVTDTDGWIDRLRRRTNPASGATHLPPHSTNAHTALPAEEEEFAMLTPGAPAPDCTLTNQSGQTIRLSDFRGRALAFTFIFTRCPFPVYCPRLNSHFAEVQRTLSTGAGTSGPGATPGSTNWHLLSISFDPEFDTPARLAKYAASQRANPSHWTFATGATSDIRALGRAFTLAFWKEGALFNHNVRTVVVDPLGRVHKVFPDNEWKPAELVAALQSAMQVPASP